MQTKVDEKQAARVFTATFLRGVVAEVDEILQEPGTGFAFARYISRTNPQVRDIAGWLPKIAPDLVAFEGEFLVPAKIRNKTFLPQLIGVPISNKVWTALTVQLTQESIGLENLQRQATYEQVKSVWLKVADMYETGELDSELLDL